MFANKTFWIAQRVPMRAHYKSIVQSHAGLLTSLEKNADILISDHMRPRDAPPGSLSYKFIDSCVEQGYLLVGEERDVHICGPKRGSVRDVGDVTRTSKTHERAAYTAEDDDVIREWVRDAVRKGDRLAGNEIWKDLERQNGRHPWQSWRDRWLKKLKHQMAPGWELEARGLEVDVGEVVEEVLEEEARTLGEGEGQRAVQVEDEIPQEEEERRGALQLEEERAIQLDERAPQTEVDRLVQREKESLFVTGSPEDFKWPVPPSSSSSPAPAVLGRVAQSKLKRRKSKQPAYPPLPPSSPPTFATTRQAQPEAQPEYSQRALSEFEREPSVGNAPGPAKRQKYHHQLAIAHEEVRTATPPVVTPTEEIVALARESKPLPRPFTAEDFLRIYDTIEDIMVVDEAGLLTGLNAFAAQTDFTPQQWHDFLRDDVRSIQLKLRNMTRKNAAIVACLRDYIERNPNQPWRRWRLHYEGRGCQVLKNNMSPDPSDDSRRRPEVRPQTPSRKRPRDELEESPHYRSPRVAETANISRQRVDINSQSTISGTSQSETIRALDDEYDLANVSKPFPHTQAILAAGTQPLDFSIPDPDGDDSIADSIADSIESDDFEREQLAALRDQELINQQLLNDMDDADASAAMDLDLPEPEVGFATTDGPSEGIETQILKDTQALGENHIDVMDEEDIEETASQASLDFDALATELMKEGHSPENIITAVHTTSANIPMIHTVLESLRLGMGVPTIMRGVWTAQDDEDILGGDARKLERVEAKHGWGGEGGCKTRQFFLRDSMAAAELVEKQS